MKATVRLSSAFVHALGVAYVIQVRSTNVVSIRPSWKAAWERISRCSGAVVLIPSTRSSSSARDMQSIASRSRRLMNDQLADHRVVIGRDGVAAVGVGIEADAESARRDQPLDLSRARAENCVEVSSALMRHSIAAPRTCTSSCLNGSGSPAATRICVLIRSMPVTISVTGCST